MPEVRDEETDISYQKNTDIRSLEPADFVVISGIVPDWLIGGL